jgi:hypothetical protein
MTISLYISRDRATGLERGFEFPYEREAIRQIAQNLWCRYHSSRNHYALIANVEQPAIDLVILSEQGLGIADLKNYARPLEGSTDRNPWWFLDEHGRRKKAVETSHYPNPFQQVRQYRESLRNHLIPFIQTQDHGLPPLQSSDSFHFQTAVVFTAQKFDVNRLVIDPAHQSWFSLLWLDDVAGWAYSLCFGHDYRLSRAQIDLLAERFFGVTPWTEIDGFLEGRETYGYLYIIVDGKQTGSLCLDQDEMIIGRALDIGLSLPSDTYPQVSRRHACIRRVPAGVTVKDLASTNGTCLNGTRLAPDTEYLLRFGDRIVLGSDGTGAQAPAGSCQLIYGPANCEVDPTLPLAITR